MAYSKQTWDTTSYVNPTRMNHMEQGIYDAEQEIFTTHNITNKCTQSLTSFKATQNGNIIQISARANQTFTNGQQLVSFPSDITPSSNMVVALYDYGTGELITSGSAWVQETRDIRYFGSTITKDAYLSVVFMIN